MRINGYCCLGFVWEIIESESVVRVCGPGDQSVKLDVGLRTIYYQQVVPIKVKFSRQIKQLEQVCRLVATSSVLTRCLLCFALHVKVIDPSLPRTLIISFCYLGDES